MPVYSPVTTDSNVDKLCCRITSCCKPISGWKVSEPAYQARTGTLRVLKVANGSASLGPFYSGYRNSFAKRFSQL
jgi:hypothetical protein